MLRLKPVVLRIAERRTFAVKIARFRNGRQVRDAAHRRQEGCEIRPGRRVEG